MLRDLLGPIFHGQGDDNIGVFALAGTDYQHCELVRHWCRNRPQPGNPNLFGLPDASPSIKRAMGIDGHALSIHGLLLSYRHVGKATVLAIAVLLFGCATKSTDQSGSGLPQSAAEPQFAGHLKILDDRTIYPITAAKKITLSPFPAAPFSYTESYDIYERSQLVRIERTISGSIQGDAAGSDVNITFRILSDTRTSTPIGYISSLGDSPPLSGVTVVVGYSRFGWPRTIHGTGSASAQDAIKQAMGQVVVNGFDQILQIPEAGVRQGDLVTSVVTGLGDKAAEMTVSYTAEGHGMYHRRSVIVLQEGGAITPRTSFGPSGPVLGTALLDEATGILIYESRDAAINVHAGVVVSNVHRKYQSETDLR